MKSRDFIVPWHKFGSGKKNKLLILVYGQITCPCFSNKSEQISNRESKMPNRRESNFNKK